MQIEKGLAVVLAPNPGFMTGSGTNQYLLGDRRRTMIDAALGRGPNLDALAREVERLDASIERILLTHIHPDHLGGVRDVAEHFGARIGMHASRRGYGGIEPDEVYDDGDRIEGDGFVLEVVHTPGHESGHCCFFERERGWLFTGDHVVGEGTVVIAPPDGDMTDYIDSLRRLLELPARRLFGGHGPVIEDPAGKIREYIEHRLEREQQVLDALASEPVTAERVVEVVYRDVPSFLHPVARMSVEAHLLKLEKESRAARQGGAWRAT